jgi:hypothetical protein
MKSKILVIGLLLLSGVAISQSPGRKINFQGKIYNNGVPVNGTGQFQFFIEQAAWGETHIAVPITNGLYSVVLGSVQPNNPIPGNLFATEDSVLMSVSYNGALIDNVTLYATLEKDYTVPDNIKDGIDWTEISGIPQLDNSVTNEIQTLSITNNVLSISGGNSINLPISGGQDGDLVVNGNLTVQDTVLTTMIAIPNAGMGSFTSPTNDCIWQSFTPISNGRLRQIVLPLGITSGSSVYVRLYNGEGTDTQNIAQGPVTGILGNLQNQVLDLTIGFQSIALCAGDVYTFEICPGTGSASVIVNSASTNPYLAGISSIGSNTDIAFSIVIDNSFPTNLTFSPNGYVGIGTDNPTAQLQVKGRIKDKTGFVMPVGSIMAYGGDVAPEGWLLCDGSTVDRIQYAELFQAIDTNWGSGDGSTTFNLPDARGRFLRGTDGAAGNDPDTNNRLASNVGGNNGNAVGSKQEDELKSHSHSWGKFDGSGGVDYRGTGFGSGSAQTGASGGNETRPKNVYVTYIIKF